MGIKNLDAVFVIVAIAGRLIVAQDAAADTQTGYRIERFDIATLGYENAQRNCEDTGIRYLREGWVVRIQDDITQRQVENLTRGLLEDYFIGLQRHDSTWYWNDGTSLTNDNWAKAEGQDENCACIRGDVGEWFDIACSSAKPFICQSDLIYIEVSDKEITALEGESIQLEAVFGTQEDPVVAYLYKLPNTETSLHTSTTTKGNIAIISHEIKNLTRKDEGEYMFMATSQNAPTLYYRTSKTSIFVHVSADITGINPLSIRSPVTTGPDQVTCTAEGTPPPTVNWRRSDSNEIITSNKSEDGVYQSVEASTAILHVETATLNDHGIYICEAVNFVTTSDFLRETRRNITLSVLGPPTIISQDVNTCGEKPSITVIWKPDENTRYSDHRVEVISVDIPFQVIANNMINPKGSETITTFISEDLDENTTYRVAITVCPDLCIDNHSDTVDVNTTRGLPNSVANNTVTEKISTCVVSWQWEDTYSHDEVSFVIRETTSFVSTSIVNESHILNLNTSDCNNNKLEYNGRFYRTEITTTDPNRNYTYTVASKTCFGESVEVAAVGECTTEYAEPNEVPPASPLPQVDGLQPILVTIPDETSGPISCIFVVMVKGENPTLTTEFTGDTVVQLSDAAKNGETENNEEYLAVAIQRSAVNESDLVVNLGEGKISSCDSKSASGQETVNYVAANWKLLDETDYTYYTLTSTPYREREGAAFQRSNSTIFRLKRYSQTEAESLGWIAAPVVGGIMIVAIIMGVVYHRKDTSETDEGRLSDESSSPESTSKQTNHAYWEIAEPGYETLDPDEETPPQRSQIHSADSPYESYEI